MRLAAEHQTEMFEVFKNLAQSLWSCVRAHNVQQYTEETPEEFVFRANHPPGVKEVFDRIAAMNGRINKCYGYK